MKNDVAHGLTVSPPNRDRLTMRAKPLKTRDLILSLSKDKAKISCFFSGLLVLILFYKANLRSRRELAITLTDDSDIAAAAMIGERRIPKKG
jgi:hypothetical protein